MSLLCEVMKHDQSVTLPAKKENSVSERAEFPKIILNMFGVGNSGSGTGKLQNFNVFINFLQFDAAIFAGVGGRLQRIEIFLDRLPPVNILVEVDFVQSGKSLLEIIITLKLLKINMMIGNRNVTKVASENYIMQMSGVSMGSSSVNQRQKKEFCHSQRN